MASILQLASLALLLTTFLQGVRQLFSSIGMNASTVLFTAAGILIGVGTFYRLLTSRSRINAWMQNVSLPEVDIRDKEYVEALLRKKSVEPSAPDLIRQLHSMDWFQFEKLVGHIYRKLGYTVTRRGGANPDGGIDLITEKDGQRTAMQCKHWKTWNVGVKAVREFLGALTDAGIAHGRFITLRGYSVDARQLAKKHGIEMVDETGLVRTLESVNARFDPEVLELLRDERKFCPKCERELIVRTAERGANPGRKFWGCSDYPRCHFTLPVD